MAKHNNTSLYPFDNNVTVNDGLLGFDSENVRRTRNFRVGSIVALVAEQIGAAINNSLVSGYVVWVEGTTYLFTDIGYWCNSQFFYIESQLVTLPNSDSTYGRIDAVYGNSQGVLMVEQGDPSPNPARPTLQLETQVAVTYILLDAGVSEPTQVSESIVYSDNLPTDWANSSSGFNSASFDSIVQPYQGTKCIVVKEATGPASVLRFASQSGLTNYDPGAKLHLYVKLDTLQNNANRIDIQLFNDSEGTESGFATLGGGGYGFDFANIDDYQAVIIPFSAMPGLAEYDGINIFIGQADNASLKIDHIRIVTGVDDLITSNTYLSLNDTVDTSYNGKENYIPRVVNGQLKLVSIVFPAIVTINSNAFRLIKHPSNTAPANANVLEVNDIICNGFWSGTEFWNRAQYSGGDTSDRNNWRAVSRVEELTIIS